MKKILIFLKELYINYLLKYKKILIFVLIGITLCTSFLINMFSNKNKITIVEGNINNNSTIIYIRVKGEVKNARNICVDISDKKYIYMFDFINEYVELTEYSDLDNINLLTKITKNYTLDIKRTNVKKDNKINIISYAKSFDKVYAYLGRTDGKIIIYEIDTSYTISELSWISNKEIKGYDLNEYIDNDLYYISNLDNDQKVCINTANIDELTKLTGIGISIANKIIEYREKNGFFNNIEDIMKISGIGENLFNKIKDDICTR